MLFVRQSFEAMCYNFDVCQAFCQFYVYVSIWNVVWETGKSEKNWRCKVTRSEDSSRHFNEDQKDLEVYEIEGIRSEELETCC